jgi:hypothetical protein
MIRAIRNVWPLLFEALPGGRNQDAVNPLDREDHEMKTIGQNGEGTQTSAEHTAEHGNTAADELDRLAIEQEEDSKATEETEVDQTTEATEEAEESEETDGDKGAKFTPEQQEVFNKRLGKEIEKRRTLETQLDELKKGQTNAEAEIARSIRLHPAYVSKDDFAVIQTVNVLESEQEALAEVQGDDELSLETLPVTTQKWIKENYPKTEVADKKMLAKRMMIIQRELHQKSSKADEAYEMAKKLQLSDLALGRKIRLEREAARNKVTTKTETKSQPAKATLKTGTRPVATGTETRKGGVDQNKLTAGGNTVEALMDAM